MSYPLWEVPLLGGGLLIAIVAITHVFISQFAVGGGLFLALASSQAYASKDLLWLDYLRRHTLFFVLASLVFGAVTGVGIWFTIGLISPQATSILIRVFVWGWAIEWCFFLIEVTAVLLFHYGWNRLRPSTHVMMAWVYAGSSMLTLITINGIVSFMLTPGEWLQTGSFWHAWFNPSMLPSMVMRIAASLALAGLYGLVTATWQAHPDLRARLIRWTSKFILTAFALFPIGAAWYVAVIPQSARQLLSGAAPVAIMFGLTFILSVIILGAAYFGPYRRPGSTSITFAVVILSLGLLTTGGGEWVREGIRKPFVIYDYLYSNGVFLTDQRDPQGVMHAAKWSVYGSVDAAPEPAEAGRDIFRLQCASCHTIHGYNGVAPLVRGWSVEFAAHQIDRLAMLKGYMPPFLGTAAERDALTAYLIRLNETEGKLLGPAKP